MGGFLFLLQKKIKSLAKEKPRTVLLPQSNGKPLSVLLFGTRLTTCSGQRTESIARSERSFYRKPDSAAVPASSTCRRTKPETKN